MSANLDELSPRYLGEDRIDITLAPNQQSPAAFRPIALTVSYDRCATDGGVVLPMELIVQGSSAQSYQRKVFYHAPPEAIAVVPREGGPCLVMLREVAHNRWWGRLRMTVQGELLEQERPV